MINKTSLYTKLVGIVIIVVLILVTILVLKRCSSEKNIAKQTPQKTTEFVVIKNGDSVTISKQLFNTLRSKEELLKSDFDDIIKEAIKKGNINPTTVIGWQQKASLSKELKLSDSLKTIFDNLIKLQKEFELSSSSNTLTLAQKNKIIQDYQDAQSKLLKTRVYFKDSTKYRYLAGNVGLDNTLVIDEESIISEPFVILGQEKTFLNLGKPKYTVLVGDKNPLFKRDSLYSTTVVPKQRTQFSVGPVILANKHQVTTGAGITMRKGIFSFSLGYQLTNFKL